MSIQTTTKVTEEEKKKRKKVKVLFDNIASRLLFVGSNAKLRRKKSTEERESLGLPSKLFGKDMFPSCR
jgi:hypothetical protein